MNLFCSSFSVSVLRRRESFLFVKKPAEIKLVIISYNGRNLVDGVFCCFQQKLRVIDAKRNDKLHWCLPGIFLEVAYKPTDTHAS